MLSVLLLFGFMAVALTSLGRLSFDLKLLDWRDFVICGTAALCWGFGTRWLWRAQILSRFLGVHPPSANGTAGDRD